MRHHLGTPLFFSATFALAALGPSCDSPTQRALTDDFRERVDAVLFEAETHRSDSDFRHTEYRFNVDDRSSSYQAEVTHTSTEPTSREAEVPHPMDAAALLKQYVLRNIADHYFEAVHVDSTLPTDTIIARLDPFSHYLTALKSKQFEQRMQDRPLRYGVELQSCDSGVIIVSVLPGSTADHAGILPGDEIQSIDGNTVNGNDSVASEFFYNRSYLNLVLFRASANQTIHKGLPRAICDESSVPLTAMIDSQIGYIHLTGFHYGTTNKLRYAVDSLLRVGMKSLVLDIRENYGGLLDESISAANLLVHHSGQTVITVSRIASQISQYSLDKEASYPNLPVVLLVNNNTCSAAEVFSGILQDLDRAVIVGQPTLGKGLVMQLFPLPNNDRLLLTTSYYMLPSGRSVQRPYKDGVLIGGWGRECGSYDNQRHTLDSVLAEGDCPAFKTASGRSVYGNTGIVPDYVVAGEAFDSPLLHNVMCGAEASYLRQNAGWLLRTTLDSFTHFCEMPQPLVDTLLSQVREHDSTKMKLLSMQLACMTPKIIKAYIAQSIWGDDGFFKLWEQNSATVRRAAELLRSKPSTIALLDK